MKKTGYLAPSVSKAFKILQTISDSPRGLGVSELSKRLGMGKSTVHGITNGLEALGVLVRDPVQKKFNLGYTLLELSRRAYGKIQLRDIAKVPMRQLMEKVGETVFLGLLNRDHVTILEVVESNNDMKITSPPGTRLPLLAAATGKVFLAQLEEKEAQEIIQRKGLSRFTSKSILDPKKFMKEVGETRKRGYAIDDEEYMLGVRAIAAPIQTASPPLAAIWLVGFSSGLTDQKMERIIPEIKKTALEISRSMTPAIKK